MIYVFIVVNNYISGQVNTQQFENFKLLNHSEMYVHSDLNTASRI